MTEVKNQETAALLDRYVFPSLVDNLINRHKEKNVDISAVCNALKTAISVETLLNNLAEVFRLSKNDIEKDLSDFGFSDLVQLYKMKAASGGAGDTKGGTALALCAGPNQLNPFPGLFKASFNEGISSPIAMGEALKETLEGLFEKVPAGFAADPFIKLYRGDVMEYFEGFMSGDAPRIESEVKKLFGGGSPKYMVTTGIGANEQFTHYVASINNSDPNRRVNWIVVNAPGELEKLPMDADIENTLFLEFSRSSLTEETVKIHEFTPREAKRIVFSNSGPLYDIAGRDGNLTLSLPDNVSGRYGRNKTPILLAPMFVAGMDVKQFWQDIDEATRAFDIADKDSLPFAIAKYILIMQKLNGKNFIYFACNDKELSLLADQFIQFWNEGVNKEGNDLLTSSFFGLPRDSHMNAEGILGNQKTKMGIFLLRTNMRNKKLNPMVRPVIDAISPAHGGLHFGDEEVILAMANHKRFAEVMPTVLIEVPGAPSLKLSAVLGQLFADVTFIYSRLVGIDPGSNPEVKFVRERSAALLAEVAKRVREQNVPIEAAFD